MCRPIIASASKGRVSFFLNSVRFLYLDSQTRHTRYGWGSRNSLGESPTTLRNTAEK
jgi:hypothetical protein